MSDAPPTLGALQEWFFAALVDPELSSSQTCAELLLDSPLLDARARLGVYQRSYISRLQACLAEQFPALAHALGEGLFVDFAREYLRACPPTSHSLHELGDRFPDWLEDNRPDRDQPADARELWIDFMVDLARYEHSLFWLYDAPGHEGQAWPSPDIDDAELVLQPCFALVASRYAVAAYYHAIRDGRDPGLPPRADAFVAVARRDYLTSSFPITAVHFEFLSALQRGASVAEALVELAERSGQGVDEVRRSWAATVRGPWIRSWFFVARDGGIYAHAARTPPAA